MTAVPWQAVANEHDFGDVVLWEWELVHMRFVWHGNRELNDKWWNWEIIKKRKNKHKLFQRLPALVSNADLRRTAAWTVSRLNTRTGGGESWREKDKSTPCTGRTNSSTGRWPHARSQACRGSIPGCVMETSLWETQWADAWGCGALRFWVTNACLVVAPHCVAEGLVCHDLRLPVQEGLEAIPQGLQLLLVELQERQRGQKRSRERTFILASSNSLKVPETEDSGCPFWGGISCYFFLTARHRLLMCSTVTQPFICHYFDIHMITEVFGSSC